MLGSLSLIREIPLFDEIYNRYENFRSGCNPKDKSCVKPKDGVKKKSIIKIVDKEGNNYCINTTNDMNDSNILKCFNEKSR